LGAGRAHRTLLTKELGSGYTAFLASTYALAVAEHIKCSYEVLVLDHDYRKDVGMKRWWLPMPKLEWGHFASYSRHAVGPSPPCENGTLTSPSLTIRQTIIIITDSIYYSASAGP
jgi:hypothetical protein